MGQPRGATRAGTSADAAQGTLSRARVTSVHPKPVTTSPRARASVQPPSRAQRGAARPHRTSVAGAALPRRESARRCRRCLDRARASQGGKVGTVLARDAGAGISDTDADAAAAAVRCRVGATAPHAAGSTRPPLTRPADIADDATADDAAPAPAPAPLPRVTATRRTGCAAPPIRAARAAAARDRVTDAGCRFAAAPRPAAAASAGRHRKELAPAHAGHGSHRSGTRSPSAACAARWSGATISSRCCARR